MLPTKAASRHESENRMALTSSPPGTNRSIPAPPALTVTLDVNGERRTLQAAPWTTLLDALREHLD